MKILKGKAALVATAFMTVLAIVAILISVRVTITVIERQEQEVRKVPPTVEAAVQTSVRVVNTEKLQEQKLYFNGQEVTGITALVSDKKEVLVSLDDILKYTGKEYKIYASDDLLEAQVNDKKLLVRIGKDSFSYGDREFKLPSAVVAAKGRILVPIEMFSHIDGFDQSHILSNNSAFIDYFADFQRIQSPKIKLLRLSGGYGGIWDLTGTRSLWDKKEGFSEEETFEASPGGAAYILKSGGKVYMINPEVNPEPYLLDVDPQSAWSGDGKNLYWEQYKTNQLSIYNIEKDLRYSLENFLWRADNLEGYEDFSRSNKRLMDFIEYGSYRMITFKGIFTGKTYSMVQKNSRIVAEGRVALSPNGKRILYSKSDGMYYVANYDGSGAVKLEQGYSASWISNNRILLEQGSERTLYDASGKTGMVTEAVWKSLGQAADGTLFFTDSESLYAENNESEWRIMSLPWSCDSVTAASMEGPYLLVSKSKNGVYSSDGQAIIKVGKYSDLLKVPGVGGQEEYLKSIQISPDKNHFLLVQMENRLVTLNLIGRNGNMEKKILLDCIASDMAVLNNIKLTWVGDSSVLLYSPQELWMVDFKDGVQIYKYKEKEGSSIEGVIKAP